MSDDDFAYLLMRLNLKPAQPAAKALRDALIAGVPIGYAARQYSVPVSRFQPIYDRAMALCEFFKATPEEAASLGLDQATANAVLAFARQRELPKPVGLDHIWAQMREAGIPEETIARLQAAQGEPR